MIRAVSHHLMFDGIPFDGLGAGTLASRLRAATDGARQEAAARAGLPGSVADRGGASLCLWRFRGLHGSLRQRLLSFNQWASLRADTGLLSLAWGDAASATAPQEALPHLPTFAHALGGFYALADFIPSVTGQDDAVDAASGLGAAGRLDVSLGRYGQERPGEVSLVIEGAERTFVAIGRWMDVRHWCAGP